HPLQPFSPRYFADDPALFTYAREWLPMVEAAHSTTERVQVLDAPPLPETLELDVLVDLLRDPVACWSRRRLQVYLPQDDQDVMDDEPFVIAGLDTYQITQPLLRLLLQDSAAELPLEQALAQPFAQLARQGV